MINIWRVTTEMEGKLILYGEKGQLKDGNLKIYVLDILDLMQSFDETVGESC